MLKALKNDVDERERSYNATRVYLQKTCSTLRRFKRPRARDRDETHYVDTNYKQEIFGRQQKCQQNVNDKKDA